MLHSLSMLLFLGSSVAMAARGLGFRVGAPLHGEEKDGGLLLSPAAWLWGKEPHDGGPREKPGAWLWSPVAQLDDGANLAAT